MKQKDDLKILAEGTQSVYRRRGLQYDAQRSKILFERKWLERFENLLPEEASILDAGCGAGEPIARYFVEKGYDLTGIDFAEPLIDLAQRRFPESDWLVADMRSLNLEEQFHGIIGWHSFFHLNPQEQRNTLKLFAEHLKSRGALMLTVGHEAGEVIGHVAGEEVYHSSLSIDEYRQILNKMGLNTVEFVTEDPNCDFATVLLAQKI